MQCPRIFPDPPSLFYGLLRDGPKRDGHARLPPLILGLKVKIIY